MSKKRNRNVVYGPVNGEVLDELRRSFDTMRLLEAVDILDEIRGRICEPEGCRAELLKLHAMAHTLINDAPMTVSSKENEPIWVLATDLELELSGYARKQREIANLIKKLSQLSPSRSGRMRTKTRPERGSI